MRMDRHEIWIGLAQPWWCVWSRRKPVRTALGYAMAEHFLPVILRSLDAHKRSGRRPATQSDLASLLGLDRGQVSKMMQGGQVFGTLDLIVLAHELDVSLSELMPHLPQLLPRATKRLVGATVSDVESVVYATYRLAVPVALRTELDDAAVEVARRSANLASAETTRFIIEKVASEVGKRIKHLE